MTDLSLQIDSGQLLTLEKTGKFTNALAYSGAIVYPEKYPNGLIIELSSSKISHSVPLLYQHKPYDVVGLTEQTAVSNGIFASGQLASNNDLANEIKLSSDWQLSIGVLALSESIPETPETVNGIEINAPVTVWRDSTIKEISLTKAPHDPKTQIQFFAKKEEKTMTEEDFKKALAAKDVEIATLKAEMKTMMDKMKGEMDAEKLSKDLADKDSVIAAKDVEIAALSKTIADNELANKKALLSKAIKDAGRETESANFDFLLELSGDKFNAGIEVISLTKKPALPEYMQHLSQDFKTQDGKQKPKTAAEIYADRSTQGAK